MHMIRDAMWKTLSRTYGICYDINFHDSQLFHKEENNAFNNVYKIVLSAREPNHLHEAESTYYETNTITILLLF